MTRSTVSILDFGNAYLKHVTNKSHLQVIPSCHYQLNKAQLREKRELHEKSPLITFNGKAYLVGTEAIKHGGINNWSGNKLSPETLPIGIYAAHPESMAIDQLVICVPDSSMELDFSSMIGIHTYTYNGRQVQLDIKDIEPIDETYGIWLGARKLFDYPEENNITITIGAGTVNLDCRDGAGSILYRSVNDRLGMMSIAGKIAKDLKAIHNLPATPKLATIMYCMAQKEYRMPGVNDFTEVFQERVKKWKESLKAFVVDSTSGDVEFWQYAIGGAGADYLPTKGNSIVVPRPQTFAIESLLALYN
jgi:hypothetical protein